MNLSDIDFAELYRRQMLRANRQEKTPEYWDGRAPAMSQRMSDSQYVRQFVAALDLAGCATLLDVGCGPGTIALTVAPRLEHVYGLDYSPGMLAAFAEEARARGLTAATPILRAWDDDWADVPVCDIVVASRSTAVPDLEAAILKLDSKARRRVYMSYPADGDLPGDDVRRAIGRDGRLCARLPLRGRDPPSPGPPPDARLPDDGEPVRRLRRLRGLPVQGDRAARAAERRRSGPPGDVLPRGRRSRRGRSRSAGRCSRGRRGRRWRGERRSRARVAAGRRLRQPLGRRRDRRRQLPAQPAVPARRQRAGRRRRHGDDGRPPRLPRARPDLARGARVRADEVGVAERRDPGADGRDPDGGRAARSDGQAVPAAARPATWSAARWPSPGRWRSGS